MTADEAAPATHGGGARAAARGPLHGFTVRLAGPHDAETVATLVHTAYRSEESRQGWTTEADLVGGRRADTDMVRELAAGEDSVVLLGLVAPDAGRAGVPSQGAPSQGAPSDIVACCHLERRPDRAYLGMFAVHPRRQGQGIGNAMVQAAQAWARRVWGSTAIEITVLNHRPELVAWYQRLGFTLTGERVAFPSDHLRFGTPRRDDLELLAMVRPVLTESGPATWARMGP